MLLDDWSFHLNGIDPQKGPSMPHSTEALDQNHFWHFDEWWS